MNIRQQIEKGTLQTLGLLWRHRGGNGRQVRPKNSDAPPACAERASRIRQVRVRSNIGLQIVRQTPAKFLPLSLVSLVLLFTSRATERSRLAMKVLSACSADVHDR